MMHVGGHHDACGGCHEYRRGVQYHGGNLLLFDYPTVLIISPRY